MDRDEEKVLVRKLVNMDETVWRQFCSEFSQPLLEFVLFWFRCSQEKAEEIVHMTFVRCVRSIGTFNPSRGRLLGWLKAVSRNEAHTLIRTDRVSAAEISFSSLPQHVADQIRQQIDTAPLPDELLAREDVQLIIQDTLVELNSRHREVLVMKHVDGLKVSEIAAKLGVSEKAAESLLSRARGAFRTVFLQKVRRAESEGGEVFV